MILLLPLFADFSSERCCSQFSSASLCRFTEGNAVEEMIVTTRSGGPKVTSTSLHLVCPTTKNLDPIHVSGEWIEERIALDNFRAQARQIDVVDRIIEDVSVEISITTVEEYGILSCPPAHAGIVVSGPEVDKPRARIVEPPRIPEGLESRVRIENDGAELVVVYPLGDDVGRCFDDDPGTPHMVRDNAVRRATLQQVLGHVRPRPVDEATNDIAVAVELGGKAELALIKEALDERSVHPLPHAPIHRVDHVLQHRGVRFNHPAQVT